MQDEETEAPSASLLRPFAAEKHESGTFRSGLGPSWIITLLSARTKITLPSHYECVVCISTVLREHGRKNADGPGKHDWYAFS